MEHMNVFHRIFHEDLHPLTNQKTKEYYIEYLKTNNTNKILDNNYKEIHPENLNYSVLKYLCYNTLLSNTLKKIKWDLHNIVFSFSGNNVDIDSIIKNYQGYVLSYMKIIEQNYLPDNHKNTIFKISKEKTDLDIFKAIYKALDSILLFLEETFMKYIDTSLEVPYQQRLWFVEQNREKIQCIQSKIQDLKVPKIVKDEISQLLFDIDKNKISGLTYESKEYYYTLIKVLDHLLCKEKLPSKEKVYAVLISLDFNTFKIFFFMTNDIKNKVKNKKTNEEKLNVYWQYQKKIKTIAKTVPNRLNPNLPSLREKVLNWIEEEITFHELLIKSEKVKELKEIDNKTSENRKLLKVSVSEVSLITKLLYDSKLVDGPRTELFSFLSKTFRTEKAALISSESLSNNYYSVSESSKRSVKKMLKGMLLQLDEMKGEL